jgi:glutaryl-CoA dehydrogenase/cyclohexanecarboxylate-CoA ligase
VVFETRLTTALINQYAGGGHWRNALLHDFVLKHAVQTPDKIAVADCRSTYSYRALLELSDRVAMGLLALGVRPRDVVSIQLPNWSEFTIVALALERIGAVINGISPIMREREVSRVLVASRSRVLIVPGVFRGFEHGEMAAVLRDRCTDLEHVLVISERVPRGCIRWQDFVGSAWETQGDPRSFRFLRPDPNDVVMVAFTSGTTGEPKGVLQTHNTLVTMVNSSIERQRFGSADVVHMAVTLGHAVGYYWGVRMPLQVGGTVVYQDTWDPAEAIRLFEAEAVTVTFGSTAIFVDLLDVPYRRTRDLSRWRLSVCGGANIPPSVAERIVERLPGRLCPVWGMTENGICTATDDTSPIEKVVSTDGSPQPPVEVRIVDPEGREMPPRQEGALLVRSPFNFIGYIQGRAFSSQFFKDDEWFDTGDLAYRDEDGYIRITGRTKDIIVRGGENIPTREIEDILVQHPGIRDVAIVAIPDERLGERACACVVPTREQTVDLAEIKTFLADRKVTRQFWPERVEVYEELPRTPSGKVQKFALRRDVSKRIGGG